MTILNIKLIKINFILSTFFIIIFLIGLTQDKNIVMDRKLDAVNISLRPLGVSRIFCRVGNRNTERLTDNLWAIALSFSNSDIIFEPIE